MIILLKASHFIIQQQTYKQKIAELYLIFLTNPQLNFYDVVIQFIYIIPFKLLEIESQYQLNTSLIEY